MSKLDDRRQTRNDPKGGAEMAENKTERVMVRMTPGHKQELLNRAEAEGFKLSEWVRLTALERARRDAARRQDAA